MLLVGPFWEASERLLGFEGLLGFLGISREALRKLWEPSEKSISGNFSGRIKVLLKLLGSFWEASGSFLRLLTAFGRLPEASGKIFLRLKVYTLVEFQP